MSGSAELRSRLVAIGEAARGHWHWQPRQEASVLLSRLGVACGGGGGGGHSDDSSGDGHGGGGSDHYDWSDDSSDDCGGGGGGGGGGSSSEASDGDVDVESLWSSGAKVHESGSKFKLAHTDKPPPNLGSEAHSSASI